MSSYWGTVSGIALHLDKKEGDAFLEQYLKETYKPDTTAEDVKELMTVLNEIDEEFIFVSSKNRKETMAAIPELQTFMNDMENYDVTTLSIIEEKQLKLPYPATFAITCYSEDDMYSGGFFTKFTKHYSEEFKQEIYDTVSIDDGYLIYSARSALPQAILNGESYRSTDEIIAEYKGYMEDYLPKNFDWASHIGFFECALYA